MTTIMDYPETKEHAPFQLMLRVNFISGLGDKAVTRYVGSEGEIDLNWTSFTLTESKMPEAPGPCCWCGRNKEAAPNTNNGVIQWERNIIYTADLKVSTICLIELQFRP